LNLKLMIVLIEALCAINLQCYLFVGYAGLLVINIFGSLTYMIASLHNGFNNNSSSSFVLSIVLAVIFTPCSFVCWYRPVYKAFQ